jgi:phosphoesterase RecJ-like protein
MIILDVPRWERVDYMKKEGFAYTIKIDHHPCEKGVCDLELVDDTAASTTQLITEFVYETKLKLNKDIASNLFLGIVSDSDRFLLSYTTPKTLMLVSRLLEDYKFELMPLYNNLYERPLDERKFESYIINNIDITENGFGSIILDNKIFKLFNVDSATASNMVNDFNFIKELKVWAFASWDERNNIFKFNIRSRGTCINEVAEKFNGGGHKFASGARLQTLEEVKELFKALDEVCKENK